MQKQTTILAWVLFLAVTLSGCQPQPIGEEKTSSEGISYEYFEINGMPCVYVTQPGSGGGTGGPSCDWSKWKGEK